MIRETDRQKESQKGSQRREAGRQSDRRQTDQWRTRRTRSERRLRRVRELEARVERLEAQLRWLRRVVRSNSEASGTPAVGPCPNCQRGVLARHSDELRCSACRYVRFL